MTSDESRAIQEALSRAIYVRLVGDAVGTNPYHSPQPDELEVFARLSAYACAAAHIHEESLRDARGGEP